MNHDFELEFDMRARIQAFAFACLPDCEILRSNTMILIDRYMTIQTEGIDHGSPEDRLFLGLDLYGGQLPKLLISANVNGENRTVRQKIQNLSVLYIVTCIAKNYGISLEDIGSKLDKIEIATLKLKDLLEMDIETTAIGASIMTSEFVDSMKNAYSAKQLEASKNDWIVYRYKRLIRELEFFSNIRSEFTNSIPGKFIQFGMSGPKERSALTVWLTGLVEIWVIGLKRTLSFSDDPNSGRDQFLSFAEDCFVHVHPELLRESSDTLRNAYEKLRKKGKFDYPNKNSRKLV